MIEHLDDQKSLFFEAIRYIIIYTIVYSVVSILSNYWLLNMQEKKMSLIEKRLEIEEKDLVLQRKDFEKVKEDLNKEYNNYRKAKIILLARIRDYSKELDFWRDTIRKILYSIPKNRKEDITKIVTNNLRTYQTSDYNDDYFESAKMLAEIMNKEVKE